MKMPLGNAKAPGYSVDCQLQGPGLQPDWSAEAAPFACRCQKVPPGMVTGMPDARQMDGRAMTPTSIAGPKVVVGNRPAFKTWGIYMPGSIGLSTILDHER